MGVPKFFRWVAERFPTVITPYRDSPPPVDNLYLDMNGIIHQCTHSNDAYAGDKSLTDKEKVEAIFSYLEKLFNAIQPRKYFFMAVDGVAPRAKMNQQRQRRYRSGYEMMVAREERLAAGDDVPDESFVFDSNCITPGTNFMVMVSEQLQYYITMKISTDPAWQNCTVVYSGHDHPGEGEHKIVDFIRRRKMQPGYDPNESHCMYGLDADLVMLALATHEPHFLLLREVVKFGPGQESRHRREQREEDETNGIVADKSYQKADEFVLFHINVLRDYLDLDVRSRFESGLPANYDFERVVDDFVFMCFFVGNDFLPSIPTLGINDGSMLTMLELYCKHVLASGMYLTNKGEVDWRATEVWMQALGEIEFHTIKMREAQEQEYQRKMAQRDASHEVSAIGTQSVESLREYKERFYTEKHGFQSGWDPQGQEMGGLVQHYVEGILWVLGYYYQGPPSWKWYFPHHYAPMVSDLVNLPAVAARVRFDVGKPFLPHQQLLAVLPPMSYRSIPRAYWLLLLSKTSPLAKYFPEHLQIDREGARAPWEGIVLIPFIEERTLLAAYESVQYKVTPEEMANNRHGPAQIFRFDSSMTPYDVRNAFFGPLKGVTVRKEDFELPQIAKFIPQLCPGVCVGNKQLEGLSTLRSKLPWIKIRREVGAVSIFGMATRKESVLLQMKDAYKYANAQETASLVGQEVLVGFPHYRRARIASISDRRANVSAVFTQDGNFCGTETKELNRDELASFAKEVDTHRQVMKEKLGIIVENINILVYVHLFAGMRVSRRGRIVRTFSKNETCYPIELLAKVQDVPMIEDPRYVERERMECDTSFGSKVIFIGPDPKNKSPNVQVYGSSGFILDATTHGDDIFTVALKVFQEPITIPPSVLSFSAPSNWMPLQDVANELLVGAHALRMLMGSLRTSPQFGSREIGLGLLYMRNNLARIGYAKLVARHQNAWATYGDDLFARIAQNNADATGHHLAIANRGDSIGRSGGRYVRQTTWFSREAVDLIKRYVKAFHPLVKRLECGAPPQSLEPPQFMTGRWQDKEMDEVLNEIESFIDESGIRDVPLACATEDVLPRDQLSELEDELDRHTPRPFKEITLHPVVKRHLYYPLTRSIGGHITQLPLPIEQSFRIGSRVVNCRASGNVAFGAVGTIVRLLSTGQQAEVVYDEPFTGGSYFDGRLSEPRGALEKLATLLVLPHTGEDEKRATEEPATEKSNTSLLKAFLLKSQLAQQQQQQQQQGGQPATAKVSPATAAFPTPKTRSAVEEFVAALPNATVRASPASLAPGGAMGPGRAMNPSPGTAVTMTGGADGIRLADLIGKIKASPASSPPVAVNRSAAGQPTIPAAKKEVASPPDNQRATSSSSQPITVSPSTQQIQASQQQHQKQQQQQQQQESSAQKIGNRTAADNASGKNGGRPVHVIPPLMLSGEFVLRHGEEMPFFKKLLKMYLSEAIKKTVAKEVQQ